MSDDSSTAGIDQLYRLNVCFKNIEELLHRILGIII